MRKLKFSDKQYRNIGGVRFECFASNPDDFEKTISEAKNRFLKYRRIDEQLYIEVIKDVKKHAIMIANKNNMPYCWEDIMNRLNQNIKLPFKN